MTGLIAASCLFLGLHLGVSGTGLRGTVVKAIGENAYMGLFALGSLGAVVWMCIAYRHAYASPANLVLFGPSQTLRNFAIPVVAFALALAVPGVLMGNPTTARQEKSVVRGVLRITRHPFLWGVAIWAGFHLVASGLLASVILFATFLILPLLGTLAIDRKARRRDPGRWAQVSAETSNVPFAAILAGRNTFVAREYFDWRFDIAVAEVAALLYFHNWLFSMTPFWNGWVPAWAF
jgi:uncharacterized membrane protein